MATSPTEPVERSARSASARSSYVSSVVALLVGRPPSPTRALRYAVQRSTSAAEYVPAGRHRSTRSAAPMMTSSWS
ncbi:hypothetical protein ABZ769_23685 [Streptomyces olivoreticuli]